jgi:hypothetical protein
VPAVAGDHAGQDGARDRDDAADVRVDHRLALRHVGRLHRPDAECEPRVVEEHRHVREGRGKRRDHGLDLRAIADVEVREVDLDIELARERFESIRASARQHETCPVLGEAARERLPESRSGSRDEDDVLHAGLLAPRRARAPGTSLR